MTIEKSPASSSVNAHKPANRTEAHAAKAKSGSGDAAPEGGGGFMAILGSLSDAAAEPTAPAAAAPDALQSGLAAPFDASTLLQQNPQIGMQAALSAGGASKDGAGLSGVSLDASAAPAASALPGDTSAGALSRRSALPGSGAADARTTLADSGQAPLGAESLTQTLQHAGAHAKASKELAQAASDSAQSGSSAASSSQGAELKDAKLQATLEQARAPQLAKALEPVFVPLLAKAEKPGSERQTLGSKNAESGYSGTALGVSAPDYSQAAVQAAPLTPDMQVAEQVTYWVTHNVQNAEMKLDGLGASPVEVSINLQGNEAQISFRSDESATRTVLENAAAHLKDMLQSEGLVLTGVSVGTSGSGDAGANARGARQAARQGLIAPLQVATVAPADSGRRLPTGAGRSVDLFV